jgi:hypothetical protein
MYSYSIPTMIYCAICYHSLQLIYAQVIKGNSINFPVNLLQLELTLREHYIAGFIYIVRCRVVCMTKVTGSSSDDWIY